MLTWHGRRRRGRSDGVVPEEDVSSLSYDAVVVVHDEHRLRHLRQLGTRDSKQSIKHSSRSEEHFL
jgi:hypothetical protein